MPPCGCNKRYKATADPQLLAELCTDMTDRHRLHNAVCLTTLCMRWQRTWLASKGTTGAADGSRDTVVNSSHLLRHEGSG